MFGISQSRLTTNLETLRKELCAYGPHAKRCDCKFGPEGPGAEHCGCPELRQAIKILAYLGERKFNDLCQITGIEITEHDLDPGGGGEGKEGGSMARKEKVMSPTFDVCCGKIKPQGVACPVCESRSPRTNRNKNVGQLEQQIKSAINNFESDTDLDVIKIGVIRDANKVTAIDITLRYLEIPE